MNMKDVAAVLRTAAHESANRADARVITALAVIFESARNPEDAGAILASSASRGVELHDSAIAFSELLGE